MGLLFCMPSVKPQVRGWRRAPHCPPCPPLQVHAGQRFCRMAAGVNLRAASIAAWSASGQPEPEPPPPPAFIPPSTSPTPPSEPPPCASTARSRLQGLSAAAGLLRTMCISCWSRPPSPAFGCNKSNCVNTIYVVQVGHTPSTAGTFRRKFQKDSGKTPETLSERFLEFPSRVRLGWPKPYNSRHLKAPEHFQNSLPPSTAGDASFFRIGSGEGLSELVMEFLAVLGVFLNVGRAPLAGVWLQQGELCQHHLRRARVEVAVVRARAHCLLHSRVPTRALPWQPQVERALEAVGLEPLQDWGWQANGQSVLVSSSSLASRPTFCRHRRLLCPSTHGDGGVLALQPRPWYPFFSWLPFKTLESLLFRFPCFFFLFSDIPFFFLFVVLSFSKDCRGASKKKTLVFRVSLFFSKKG